MPIYLLKPLDEFDVNKNRSNENPWLIERTPYDKVFGFVIRAKDSKEARRIADNNAGDENHGDVSPWLSPKCSSCRQIKDGASSIILKDYFGT